jgi:hypothetical protein
VGRKGARVICRPVVTPDEDSCTAATPGLGFDLGFDLDLDLDLDLEDQLAERERLCNFSRGNFASLMRRVRRRSVRSSTSAARTSAK